jgi:methylmalonyl-CoA mutase
MSKFPDFKDVAFADGATAAAPEGAVWNTPEGVDVAPAFTPTTPPAWTSPAAIPASRPICAAPTRPCT